MTVRSPSLERRLIVRLSLLYLATLLVAVVTYVVVTFASRDFRASENFQQLAHRLAAAVVRDGGGALHLEPAPGLKRQLAAIDSFQMVVSDADGRVIESSAAWLEAQLRAMPPAIESAEFTLVAEGHRWLGVLAVAPGPGTRLRVALVYARPSVADTLAWVAGELSEDVLPVMVPAMLLSLLVGIATVRTTVAPVRRLSAELAAIGRPRVALPLAEDGVPVEVLPMVRAVNHALGRLDAALDQQRRMTANAAHELRTPLAILRARIEGIADPALRDPLERDVVRMTRLVEQLMAVARLEAGQVAVDEAVDLARVARETLAACAPLALAKGRGVELAAPDRPVMVRGNALALGDALMNLVDNALRFTAVGDSVEVTVEAPAGRGAVLEVRDRGPGIAPAERAEVFEPFWRGRDSRGPGSGLGLAIVAETVALHGGTVTVEERDGGGSVFRIELAGGGRGDGRAVP